MDEKPSPSEEAKLGKVTEWLRNRKAYVAVPILQLGQVRFIDAIDTAGVRVTGEEIELFFNRDFFHQLKLVELTAVLLHEALHVVFRHQARAENIANHWERRLFTYGCETVINDTILRYFKEVELPRSPITGKSLLGTDTSQMTAEQVASLLKQKLSTERLLQLVCLDDHDLWDPEEVDSSEAEVSDGEERKKASRWDLRSDGLVDQVRNETKDCRMWGSAALGAPRLAPRHRNRTDLKRFLTEQIRPANRFATIWSRPNRKAMSVYPEIILPLYRPENWLVTVLMAIDASGSVSDHFLGVARSVASQHLPGTRIKMVSFDTEVYEVKPDATTLPGGGGTDGRSVEKYIQETMKPYPDYVFLFTDGYMDDPRPEHPERWIWLLEPNGTDRWLSRGSRAYRFDPRKMKG